MFDLFLTSLVFAAGYIACAYTWQPVKTFMNGEMAEAAKLRAKAADLEAKLRASL